MAPLEIVYIQKLCIPTADGALQVYLAVRTNKPILCRVAVMGAALLRALGMSDTRSALNISQRAGYVRLLCTANKTWKAPFRVSPVSGDTGHESTPNPE